jgi:hypothetical protein
MGPAQPVGTGIQAGGKKHHLTDPAGCGIKQVVVEESGPYQALLT